MNLQAEKLKLIEWIAQTQDVEFVSRIAEMLKAKNASTYKTELTPMTVGELKMRLEASEADFAAGRVHSLEDIMKEFE